MRNVLTMKQLATLLAALVVLSAVFIEIECHHNREDRMTRVIAELEREHEQMRKDDTNCGERPKRELEQDEKFREEVEGLKKKSHPYVGNESKALTSKP